MNLSGGDIPAFMGPTGHLEVYFLPDPGLDKRDVKMNKSFPLPQEAYRLLEATLVTPRRSTEDTEGEGMYHLMGT